MHVQYKTSGGSSWVPIESKLLSDRKIFIKGDINSASACEFVQEMMYLTSIDPAAPIDIYISSNGGEVNAGLLIYDTIKGQDIEINTYCMGTAASMAAIILAGGQKGRRFIFPHSKVMIHEPLAAGGLGGSATTIRRAAESIMEIRQIAIELLASDTGKPIKAIEKAISFDNYMGAEEAVAFGLCDAIVTKVNQ